MVDIKYSQNFYKNRGKLKEILNKSGINNDDIVIDIGAGKGMITEELSKYAKKVIAYELDSRYFEILEEKFLNTSNIVLNNNDFLSVQLPKESFKVFSNIPFSLTSDIINKITDVNSNLSQAFLFVQRESAERFTGKPRSTQISTILSFMYDIDILDKFKKEDFSPPPQVEIVLLSFKRKDFNKSDFALYRDFVTYIFNQRNRFVLDIFKQLLTYNQVKYVKKYLNEHRYSKPTQIPSDFYLMLFEKYKENGSKYINRVNGYYLKHLQQHSKREKVNRTRKGK